MKILGIETSCDETAAAVVELKNNCVSVQSNIVSSQINIHKKYGGVVPEVAAREHVNTILPVINKALKKAKISRDNAEKKLSAIAVATGPGLITSLIVGIETAKTLAFVWQLPLLSVDHINGHIFANFINFSYKKIKFPCMALTVSGGHTKLLLLKNIYKHQTVGETRDDAAGEAFDKAAQLLGLGYPGGPAIALCANKINSQNSKLKKQLPRPMINDENFDFSFSGLKTALRYDLVKDKDWQKNKPLYAQEFQQAVVDVLIKKTIKAAKKYQVKSILLAGGVAANIELRKQLHQQAQKNGFSFYMPDLAYTTDNAAMIAAAGCFLAKEKKFTPWQKLTVNTNS